MFYADCRKAVEACGFQDLFFADDLNCWKSFAAQTANKVLREAAGNCQKEVHDWGAANRVVFDADKESLHVLSPKEPDGVSTGSAVGPEASHARRF